MLLSALRQHFQHIVVNLTGQADSEALRTFVSHCDKLIWYTDQNVLDCRRNLEVLNQWREKGMKLDHAAAGGRYLRASRRTPMPWQKLRHGGDRGPAPTPECA
jgi:pilus assembly protein CpaE